MTDGPSPPETPRRREPDPYVGAAMMAVGGLIAALFGGCTLMIVANSPNSAVTPLILGGIPTLLGALLFRAGFRVFRGDPR
jgi:MFS superfamily sulfate permease-like transporter